MGKILYRATHINKLGYVVDIFEDDTKMTLKGNLKKMLKEAMENEGTIIFSNSEKRGNKE